MKKILLFLISAMLILAGCAAETPADYPSKEITLVVPWGAGGGTDLTARVFASLLEEELGQSVVVQNKTGASGATGTDYVYSQDADGYTLLFSADTIATMQVMGFSELSVDNFQPIMMVSHDPKIITVSGDSEFKTIEDLVSAAKENPNKLNLCYSGPGASGHIQGLLLKKAGVEFNMTPLGGGTAQMLSVISGESEMTNPSRSTVTEYLSTGELVNLAMFDSEGEGDIPSITKAIPELDEYMPLTFPVSILAKEGTDPAIMEKLTIACENVANSEGWKDYIEQNSLIDLTEYKGEAATDYIKRLSSIYSWLLYDEGVATKSPEEFNIERFAE